MKQEPIKAWTPDQALYRVNTTCRILDISRPTLYRLVKNGRLDLVKFGSASRITADSIMSCLSGLTNRAA